MRWLSAGKRHLTVGLISRKYIVGRKRTNSLPQDHTWEVAQMCHKINKQNEKYNKKLL